MGYLFNIRGSPIASIRTYMLLNTRTLWEQLMDSLKETVTLLITRVHVSSSCELSDQTVDQRAQTIRI